MRSSAGTSFLAVTGAVAAVSKIATCIGNNPGVAWLSADDFVAQPVTATIHMVGRIRAIATSRMSRYPAPRSGRG